MSGREQFEAWASGALAPGLGVQVSELVALADEGRTPMVIDPAQPAGAVLRARTVVDLHAAHIGQQVLLAFEGGDASRPIVLGVMRGQGREGPEQLMDQVEVMADGSRVVVSAKDQLVLRCGKASITLTRQGKVLINGAYVSSRSTGVNRVSGGSVLLN